MQFLDWMQCITKPVGKKIRTVVTQGSNNNITQLTKYFSANVDHRIPTLPKIPHTLFKMEKK